MISSQVLTGRFNGLDQKIAFIKACYQKSFIDPRIRRFAEQAAGRGDRVEQATNLFNATRKVLSYLPDPIGVEMTKSPSVLFDDMEGRGYAQGDCDDHACLAFALLQSIGIPARLRVAWYPGSSMPRHIYALAFIGGRLYPFDTTRKAGFGTEAPYLKKEDF